MTASWDALPEAFRTRTQQVLPADALARWQAGFSSAPAMAVRWTGPGTLPVEAIDALQAAGLQPRPMDWYEDGVHLEAGDRAAVRALPLFKDGSLTLQSASSMFAVLALAPESGQDVLDLCAAPGGKTALLHRLMDGTGRLVANDLSRRRMARLRDQLQVLGVDGVKTMCGDGVLLSRDLASCFDRVLVDAPCSGEGRWHGGDQSAWANWSLSTTRTLAKRQETLLRAACRMVRPGGRVVYATCTLAPEENEHVVSRVLAREPVCLRPIDLASPAVFGGLTQWGVSAYDEQLQHACRLLPCTDGFTGFFVALLERT